MIKWRIFHGAWARDKSGIYEEISWCPERDDQSEGHEIRDTRNREGRGKHPWIVYEISSMEWTDYNWKSHSWTPKLNQTSLLP